MNNERLEKLVGNDKLFSGGICYIDIAGSRMLKGSGNSISSTKSLLIKFLNNRLPKEAFSLNSQGDNLCIIFVSQGCDEMVLFADEIRYLISYFNGAKITYNKLEYQQDIYVRIVCHWAKEIHNPTGKVDNVHSSTINTINNIEKQIGLPNNVIITADVHSRISSQEISSRLSEITFNFPSDRNRSEQIPESFGKVYILDEGISSTKMYQDNRNSSHLQKWIRESLEPSNHGFQELLYFAYTNERLSTFLGFYLRNRVNVRIVTRNWMVERREEQAFNEKQIPVLGENSYPWIKAVEIEKEATKLIEEAQDVERQKTLGLRFYKSPPIFKGAILVGNNDRGETISRARIGLCKWDKNPASGSPYKLDEWPAINLDSRDKVQALLLEYIQSRFDELWDNGSTYESIREEEQKFEKQDPKIIGKIWALDKEYLILYPHRPTPKRLYPSVAYEDLMALKEIESFFQKRNVAYKPLGVKLPTPKERSIGNYPPDIAKTINEWSGHIVYICHRSVPPEVHNYLSEIELPFKLSNLHGKSPFIQYGQSEKLISPMDCKAPEAKDYSLLTKFKCENGNGFAYLFAGIHAMGTWGATSMLVQLENIHNLAKDVQDKQFAATIETEFDTDNYQIKNSKWHHSPRPFGKGD